MRNTIRKGLQVAVWVTVTFLIAGCNTPPSPEGDTSSFERLATFDGLDTRQVLMVDQERTAECMAREGFEYVPYVPRGSGEESLPVRTLAQIPNPAYAQERGYGFADSIEIQANAANEDPNPPIFEALDPEERSVYFTALYGQNEPGSDSAGGCAQPTEGQYFEVVVERRDLLAEAGEWLFSDPQYVDLEAQWSRCMAGHGLDLQNRLDSILAHFEPQMIAIHIDPDPHELEELRHAEIEVALLDIECIKPLLGDLEELAAEHEERLEREAAGLFDDMAELRSRYMTSADTNP